MNRRIVCNVFSLAMLGEVADPVGFRVVPLTADEACAWLEFAPWESFVGHADHAVLMSASAGTVIPFHRASVTVAAGDHILVGQYVGPRMAEGHNVLPEGATLRWLLVTVGA